MKLRKTITTILLTIGLATAAFADFGDLGLMQSVTGGGGSMGGLRVDLGSGFVTDFTFNQSSGESTSAYDGWIDIYYGSWGLLYTFAKDTEPSFDVVYAIEQSINENIALGIYTNPIGYNASAETYNFFTIFDAYIVLSI